MEPDDIVFTTTNSDRNITYILKEGKPESFGKQHIINQRPFMSNKISAIKHAVENADICYWDEEHREKDREKVYCLGADKERPQMYMKVIVEYNNENEGTIITAWPQKKISPSEGVITYVKSKK